MPADDEQKQKDELSSTTDDGHSSGNSQDDVLGVDVPSASCSGSKRKRDGLDIPASNTASLPSWVVGASPTRFVSVEELMAMSVALENMALIHEIAVNPDFVIDEKPTDPVEKVVGECMKKAYWDKLREDFSEEPPDYSHALVLLADIKRMVLDLLSPQHVRLRSQIECMFDVDLLKQQVEKKCLDVRSLFESIIELLSRLCAPARDDLVNSLREKSDSVDMLRGICEVIELMKVDMANFYVRISRSVVEQHSADYERTQFMKLLEKNPEMELPTLEWLKRHVSENRCEAPSAKKRFEDLNNSEVSAIISDAYMDLLEWDPQYSYPETLKLDRLRLEAVAEKYLQLIICTSCVLVSCNLAGKDVAQAKDFKTDLKNDAVVITNDINKSNVKDRLEAVSILCNKKVSECREALNISWTKERSDELKEQIVQLIDCDNPVRKLIRDRVRSFILSMTSNPEPSDQLRFPPGLSVIHGELSALTARFVRIINHNRHTFGTYYGELIKKLMNECA